MLVHKGGQINNVQLLITGLRIAKMSQLQNCSVMCTKNGSYCENEKREKKSGGMGDVYKEWKLLWKGKKSQGGGVRVDVNGEVKLLWKFNFFFLGGGGGGGGGQGELRSEVFVKIKKKTSSPKGNDAHLRAIIQRKKKWKHQFFRRLRAANSVVRGLIWPNFKLIQALMYVIITCKYEKDSIKNNWEKGATRFFKL